MTERRRWLQWASALVLIAVGCALPWAAVIAAPQTSPGKARIWFYRGYEPPAGAANYSPASIPTIVANGSYIGTAPSGSVFYRDLPLGVTTLRSRTLVVSNINQRISISSPASRPLSKSF